MGGSVAVHVAAKKSLPSLAGLVVVDVVEVAFYSMILRALPLIILHIQGHFEAILTIIQKFSGNSYGFINSHAENPVQQDAAFFKLRKSGTSLI